MSGSASGKPLKPTTDGPAKNRRRRPDGDGGDGDPLAAAIWVKSAVHAGGLVGGIGLKVVDVQVLQDALAGPDGEDRVVASVVSRVHDALQAAGIGYGVQEDQVEAAAQCLVEAAQAGSTDAFARKVAEGEAPEPGQAGYLEYLQNYRGLSFAELSSLPPNSPKKKRTVVHALDVLAIQHPPTQAKDGTGVMGEELPAPAAPAARPVSEIAGPNTVVDKDKVLAECDGLCEEDVEGWLRVVPEIVLERVDQTTGHIPEAGVSEASIAVIESVSGGVGVSSTEAVFVGTRKEEGAVEGSASVRAMHLVVHGAIVGEGEGDTARIEVDEYCAAREVRNRSIEAAHILVAEDSHFALLNAEQEIRVDGTLRGGTAQCGASIEVRGDLGTEAGGSGTRIVVPAGPVASRKAKRATVLAGRYRAQGEELREKLDDLERRSQKRAKADAYWAKLAEGERPRPSGPLQAKTLKQFAETHEQRKTLERQMAGCQRAVQKLGEVEGNDEESGGAAEIAVSVGATLYMDVAFEASRSIGEEDGELGVSFSLEGDRLAGKALADVKALLTKQVNEYREQQSGHIEERRKALEELHKGQSKKPEAPKMEDHTFTMPITWEERQEGEDAFTVTTEVKVRALEPGAVMVCNSARLKEPVQNVTVTVGGEGARATYRITPNAGAVVGWQGDDEVRQVLEGIVIRGAPATDLLAGEAMIQID